MAMERIDVCIICALPEEATAFKNVLLKQGAEVKTKHSQQQRDYFYTTIPNKQGQPLSILVTWQVRTGMQETLTSIEKMLQEFEPRFVAMTGFCAGNRKQLMLGDLIVADKTFIFDNGSVTRNQSGQEEHQYNIITFQMRSEVLQALHMFTNWTSVIGDFKQEHPISKRQQREWLLNQLLQKTTTIYDLPDEELSQYAPGWRIILQELQQEEPSLLDENTLALRDPQGFRRMMRIRIDPFPYKDTEPACHIGSLASGNAVRRDNPFPEIEKVDRKILGVDMEGTAIYYAFQERPQIRFLVAKGVSDYADGTKDDRYHSYAATLSAAYIATFITQFVNDEYMPWPDKPIITPAQPATSQSVAPSSQSPKPSPGTSATETTKLPVKIVLSYSKSDKDQKLIEEFNNQLTILKRLKPPLIEIWDRHHIEAGNSGNDEIQKKFAKAQIILLMMSPDYYSSDYYEDEIKLIEQCYSNHARVIPILLRDTDDSWKTGFFFGDLQPLPRKGNAVTSWTNRDEVLAQIAKEIKEVAQNIQKA